LLFMTWLAALIYPVFRPIARAWIELSVAAALLYALVPVINALTTTRHLWTSFIERDWVFVSFDVSMLLLAAAFAWLARKLARRRVTQRALGEKLPSHDALQDGYVASAGR
jgi:hypothetical protein